MSPLVSAPKQHSGPTACQPSACDVAPAPEMIEAKAYLDPTTWPMVNPNMGYSVDPEFLLREFGKAIAACVPGLSKEELYWRLDFLAGALTYAMADFGLIKRPTDVTEAAHRERAANELIRFAQAGILAGH